MRVLVAHNYYRSANPSGENLAVQQDIKVLRDEGVEVAEHCVSSDVTISRPIRSSMAAAAGPIWSSQGSSKLRESIENFNPDLVHVHNLFPFLSPTVISTVQAAGLPVVMTLHNYRLECVKGTFYRNGRQCFDCRGQAIAVNAIRHGCYRESRLQSVPMVVGQSFHRKSFQSVDKVIALTEFMRDWAVAYGIPRENVVIRPSSAEVSSFAEPVGKVKKFAFVGRLDEEKGITELLDAWRRSGVGGVGWELIIAGAGPLEGLVQASSQSDSTISFRGSLSSNNVSRLLDEASVVVVPSRWLEGYPRIISEAFMHGCPVIVSDNVNLRSIVGKLGWVAGSETGGLAGAIVAAATDRVARDAAAAAARLFALSNLGNKQSGVTLLNIYRDALNA